MDTDKCPKVIDQALGGDYNDCSARSEVVLPADIMAAITEEQCQNLKNNTGIYGDAENNCEDFQGLLCDIRQDLEAVLVNQSITIFANDFSKCSDTDENPTLASMWSRIYRFAQAVTCVFCAYDPFMSVLLKSGRYPQVLMGSPTQTMTDKEMGCSKVGYPVWVTPDDYPTKGSYRPITSDAVYKAIYDAILSVWHLWEEWPEFAYYADGLTTGEYPLDSYTDMDEYDYALVKYDGTDYNVIYQWYDDDWQKKEVLGTGTLPNFTVTNIKKGYWAGKEIYYFEENGSPTWNLMDANLTELEQRVAVVEQIYERAVLSETSDTSRYLITTRATYSQAMAVPVTSGKVTLTFITG